MVQFKDGAHRVRAKVYVNSITNKDYYKPAEGNARFNEVVEFRFVNGNDPDTENAKFWDATPEAQPVQMTIRNPGAQGLFKIGEEFYLDFVEAVRVEDE